MSENYWCHECQLNIRPGPDLLCPHCFGGFIEQVTENDPPQEVDQGYEMEDDDGGDELIGPLRTLLRNLVVAHLAGHPPRDGEGPEAERDPEEGEEGEEREEGEEGEEEGLEGEEFSGDEEPEEEEGDIDDLGIRLPTGLDLVQFIAQLRAGRIGDYVIGNQGLDNVISQLMEQEAAKVKNPAPDEIISSLPTITAGQFHIDEKSSCTVCREEYELGQSLTELPCHHFFHRDCLEPWLHVNGNCPVCRLSLVPEEQQQQQQQEASQPVARNNRIGRLPGYQNPPEFFQLLLNGNGNGAGGPNGGRSRPSSRQSSTGGGPVEPQQSPTQAQPAESTSPQQEQSLSLPQLSEAPPPPLPHHPQQQHQQKIELQELGAREVRKEEVVAGEVSQLGQLQPGKDRMKED